MKKLVVAVLLFCAFSAFSQEKESKRFIDVNGTAEVNIPADRIDFSVQVRIISQTIAESKKQVDANIKKLLGTLNKFGISDDDIDQSPVILGKNYEYNDNKRELNGYFASSNISFKLKKLSDYYSLSDELASNQDIEIVGSGYSLSNYEKHNLEAYEKALKAAESKAEFMCKTLGVKTGKILEIDENNQNYPNPFNTRTMLKSDEGGGEVISGKVSITRTVRIKYEIE